MADYVGRFRHEPLVVLPATCSVSEVDSICSIALLHRCSEMLDQLWQAAGVQPLLGCILPGASLACTLVLELLARINPIVSERTFDAFVYSPALSLKLGVCIQ